MPYDLHCIYVHNILVPILYILLHVYIYVHVVIDTDLISSGYTYDRDTELTLPFLISIMYVFLVCSIVYSIGLQVFIAYMVMCFLCLVILTYVGYSCTSCFQMSSIYSSSDVS